MENLSSTYVSFNGTSDEDEIKHWESDIPKLPSVKNLAKMFQPNINPEPREKKIFKKVMKIR